MDKKESRPRYQIGVDIGGTFTDIMVVDERDGTMRAHKTPTTPDDPSTGLLSGVREAAAVFGFGLDQVTFMLLGTTIATNAVLERRLAKGALVTNPGFTDVLEIGRHLRREPYTLRPTPQPVLIPRDRRYGVAGRIGWDGAEEAPLDEAGAAAVADALRGQGIEAVAVSLLHAYRNPGHEERIAAILRDALPYAAVSVSSEVSPEIREFERSSTTVLNALLQPVVRTHLDSLAARLAGSGLTPALYLVQSNGGVTTPAQAARLPVRLLLSGPSGGATAAARLARRLGRANVVAVDMGGTSFDVSVIRDGESVVIPEGSIDGLPVRAPMVEMRTIGAGGGSIASVPPGGGLDVGPRSAGAVPGPAAYGKGGTEPTVTDANVALGRIDPDFFLGGAVRLDREAARTAVRTRVAGPLGLGTDAAAEGILAVANARMASAIKLSLFEKGADPREFALASFGGAGGLHAVALAEELDIAEVIFPRDPGTLSARGILASDIAHDVARSRPMPAEEASLPTLAALALELFEAGRSLLERDGIRPDAQSVRLAADMRYRGQAFELTVPWDAAEPDPGNLARLIGAFHDMHERRYAHADPTAPVEIVTLRATALGTLPRPEIRPPAVEPGPAKGTRRAFLGGGWLDLPVRDRDRLGGGTTGPAIIEEQHTTLLIPQGWVAEVASDGSLVARRAEGGA